MRTLLAVGSTPRIAQLRRNVGYAAISLFLGLTVSGAGRALSALPPAGAVSSASTFGSTLTIPRPATTTGGDVLIASVDARLSSTGSIAPPAGWGLIRRDGSTAGF